MTQFSPDVNPSPRGTGPSRNLRQAAQAADRPGRPGPRPGDGPGGHKERRSAPESSHHRIGRPGPSPGPTQPQQPEQARPSQDQGDYRHVLAMAQWENMRRLGREGSWGIWAHLNGLSSELLQPGQAYYDVLED